MFKKFFAPKKKDGGEKGKPGAKPPAFPPFIKMEKADTAPQGEAGGEEPDGEYQIPFLQRGAVTMTADLMRRMEEEKLCRDYQLSPTKTGTFI